MRMPQYYLTNLPENPTKIISGAKGLAFIYEIIIARGGKLTL